jgi:putative oxidoreductase
MAANTVSTSSAAQHTLLQAGCDVLGKVRCATAFLPPLLTRLLIGHAFFVTGRGKLGNLDNVINFFTSLGVPAPQINAVFIANLEFFGGIALILGLGTRLFSALLGCTMLVAIATAHRQAFFEALSKPYEDGLTDIVPVMFGSLLLWLVYYGPGLLSLDTLAKFGLEKAGWIKPAAPRP